MKKLLKTIFLLSVSCLLMYGVVNGGTREVPIFPKDLTFFPKASGTVNIQAGGTDQNITLTPSGTGKAVLPNIDFSAGARTVTLANVADALNIDANTLVIDALNNRVCIGCTAPGVKLDVVATPAIRMGDTISDATNKAGKLVGRHYTNAEEDLLMLFSSATVGGADLHIGGGGSTQNSHTELVFYTDANSITLTGTERLRINSGGNFGFSTSTFGTNLAKGFAIGAGAAATTSPADIVQAWVADYAAGDARLYIRSELGDNVIIGNGALESAGALTLKSGGTNTDIVIDPIGTGKVVIKVPANGPEQIALQTQDDAGNARITFKHIGSSWNKILSSTGILISSTSFEIDSLFNISADLAMPFKIKKSTVAVTAPGVGVGGLRWEVGTNAGTLKLVSYAGTSTTGVTIVDNVGAGN